MSEAQVVDDVGKVDERHGRVLIRERAVAWWAVGELAEPSALGNALRHVCCAHWTSL